MKRAFVAVMAILVTGTGRADWQYTRWGMTPDEVMAAAGPSAVRGDWYERSNDAGRTLVSAPYVGQGLHFKANFLFSRKTGRLIAVHLISSNPRSCGSVRSTLIGVYGPPADSSAMDTMRTVEWFDRRNGNDVSLSWLTNTDDGFCNVIYEPLLPPNAKGGL